MKRTIVSQDSRRCRVRTEDEPWGTLVIVLVSSQKQSIKTGLRLCRLPCGKPLAFRQARISLAAMPPEAKPLPILWSIRKARGFPHGRRQSRIFQIGSLVTFDGTCRVIDTCL